MGEAEGDLRARLELAGLGERAEVLLELAAPSVRLRGEAGDAARMLVRPPTRVWGLESGVKAIAMGGHGLALCEDGTVLAWGANGAGQLGDGTTKLRREPVLVVGLSDVTAVAAGGGHSLALSSSGGVWAWGANSVGQLGDGSIGDGRPRPALVPGLEQGVMAIVAGSGHNLVVRTDGSVRAWGLSVVPGEAGLDHARASPCVVPELEDVVAIAAGGYHYLALTAGGTVLAWGLSDTYGLGVFNFFDLSRPTHITKPAVVPGLPAVRWIAAGQNHSLAVTTEDAVFAWGRGSLGELGDGSRDHHYPPAPSNGLSTTVRAVAAANGCSFAIRSTGALLSWGWNYQGRLGDGTTIDRLTPSLVPALASGVTAISDRLALMADGSVMTWGGEYRADARGADARLDVADSKLGGRPDLRWAHAGPRANADRCRSSHRSTSRKRHPWTARDCCRARACCRSFTARRARWTITPP